LRGPVAFLGPAEGVAARNGEGRAGGANHGAVRQFADWARYRVYPFTATCQPLRVQLCIHFVSQRDAPSSPRGPGGAKRFGGLAPTKETGTVTRSERYGLVKEEELRPTAALHHLAPAPFIVEDANQPRLGRPAPPEQTSPVRPPLLTASADAAANTVLYFSPVALPWKASKHLISRMIIMRAIMALLPTEGRPGTATARLISGARGAIWPFAGPSASTVLSA
jgi:hypothetical protein